MAQSNTAFTVYRVIFVALAIFLVLVFLASGCEVIGHSGLLDTQTEYSCSGPFGFERTVTVSANTSSLVVKLEAFWLHLVLGGGILSVVYLGLKGSFKESGVPGDG